MSDIEVVENREDQRFHCHGCNATVAAIYIDDIPNCVACGSDFVEIVRF
jgi:hypothetical protein